MDSVARLAGDNSAVWRVQTAHGDFVVKHLTDPTSDLAGETWLGQRVAHTSFRAVEDAVVLPDETRAVLARYVEGERFDDVLLREDATPEEQRRWADQMHELFAAIARVPVSGFGAPATPGRATAERWSAFLAAYLERQRHKAPRLAGIRYAALAAALARITAALDATVTSPVLVPADVNLRNFLVTGSRSLVVINVPLLWHGDPAEPYGDALIHVDGRQIADRLREHADAEPWRLSFYAAFAAYCVLAYVERFADEPLDKARPWGGRRPLLDILDEHLEVLAAP